MAADDDVWLAEFHAGSHAVIERCYRDECASVLRAVGRLLSEADAETVTHEVFHGLLSNQRMRLGFRGGNLGAWLTQVARNAALDHLRRARREESRDEHEENSGESLEMHGDSSRVGEEVEAKLLVEQFRREHLPPAWAGVFEARFLRHLPQREAADELGMRRTTLVYQEQRIRELLRSFLLDDDEQRVVTT